jgi:hypothetical protein
MSYRIEDILNLPKAAADPLTGEESDLYFNTATKKIRVYDGTMWKDALGGGGAEDPGDTVVTVPQIGFAATMADNTNPVAGNYGWTEIALPVVDWDSNNSRNGGRWTVPKTGLYRVSAHASWDVNPNGVRGCRAKRVGDGRVLVTSETAAASASNYTQHGDTAVVALTQGDVIAYEAHQNSGAIVGHKKNVSAPGSGMSINYVGEHTLNLAGLTGGSSVQHRKWSVYSGDTNRIAASAYTMYDFIAQPTGDTPLELPAGLWLVYNSGRAQLTNAVTCDTRLALWDATNGAQLNVTAYAGFTTQWDSATLGNLWVVDLRGRAYNTALKLRWANSNTTSSVSWLELALVAG